MSRLKNLKYYFDFDSIFNLDIEHIYLLVRSKRGHNANDRLKELLTSPVRFLKVKLRYLFIFI